MKTRVILVALAAALLGTGSALAQLRGGTVEINPFAGYLFGGSFGRASIDFTPSPYHVDVVDDANYGGRIGYNFSSIFELEFEYSRTDTTFERNPDHHDNLVPSQTIGDLKIQYFMGYGTFHFGHGRLVPFFTIGGGAADLAPRVTGVANRSDTRFTAGFGGGVKYFVNPHFGLRADGRLLSTYLGTSNVFCGYYYVCTQRNWLTNFVGSGGLIVAF